MTLMLFWALENNKWGGLNKKIEQFTSTQYLLQERDFNSI